MPQRLSREEFRQWTATRPERYERVCGEPVAMSPERAAHIQIKYQVWAALTRAIQAGGIEGQVIGDGLAVEIDDDTDYEPDAVVSCGPGIAADGTSAPNPLIVVEVLSPSRQSIDTSEKLAGYFRVSSIRHYLIVGTRRREVIHHWRAADAITSRVIHLGSIELDPPGFRVDIADISSEPRFAP